MSNLIYYGYLVLGTVSFALFISVFLKYRENENKLSLYLMGFFLIGSIGYLTIFITSPILLNNYAPFRIFTLITALIALLFLFLFVAKVSDLQKSRIIIVVSVMIVLFILYVITLSLIFFLVIALGITVVSVILFFNIYKNQHDSKSLGFAIGLILLNLGNGFEYMPGTLSELGGVFLMLTALCYLLGFLDVFKRRDD